MALLSQTALRGDPVLNHNFVISLLDTSSALATGLSVALSAIFDVALGGFSECHRAGDVDAARGVQGGRQQRRGPQVPEPGRVVEHHAEERHRRGNVALGLALRLRRRATESAATA